MASGTVARKRCVFAEFLQGRCANLKSTSVGISPAISQPRCMVGIHFEDVTNAAHILVPMSLALDHVRLSFHGFDI